MQLIGRVRAAWGLIAPRFGGYELVLPDTPAFRCLSSACPANCCRPYSVPLDEEDLARFVGRSGLPVEEVVECEEGRPVVLPLAEPYLLARSGGACKFLASDGRCQQYDARPSACRLYPFQALLVDEGAARIVSPSARRLRDAFAALDGVGSGVVPVLIRHRACPGFVAEPLGEARWRELLRSVMELQYRHRLVRSRA